MTQVEHAATRGGRHNGQLHVIQAASGWPTLDLRALWDARELLMLLVWRDIKVRYKQTALGVAWAVLQPLLATAIFTAVFGRLTSTLAEGAPYPVFVLAGMTLWTLFSSGLSGASDGLLKNEQLVKRVYFPRLVIPLAAVLSPVFDAVFASVVLIVCLLVYGVEPRASWLFAPVFMLLAVAAAFGIGAMLSALNARYRDVQHAVPFFIQVGFIASPIAYASSSLPEGYRTLFGLNPVAGLIEGFRSCLFGTALPVGELSLSLAVIAVLAVVGALAFRLGERTLVDVL